MKKEYIIGAVALAAVVGGYLWYKSTKKDVVDTTPTPKADPLEGKLISTGNTEGKYASGMVFKYFKGKKYVVTPPIFKQFTKNNTDKGLEQYTGLVILSQEKIDAIPLGGATVDSAESVLGSAKVKGLYDGRDIYLGTVTGADAGKYTSGVVWHIKGDKKYSWSSPSCNITAAESSNKIKYVAVTQEVIDMFTDAGAEEGTKMCAGVSSGTFSFSGEIFANANGIFLNSGDTQIWK